LLIMSTDPFTIDPAAEEVEANILTWDDSYAIAGALRQAHPEVELEQVSLGMIYRWTLELSVFADDPQLANEEILSAILQEWLEEVISK
jgi:FeS assembly protein IscX